MLDSCRSAAANSMTWTRRPLPLLLILLGVLGCATPIPTILATDSHNTSDSGQFPSDSVASFRRILRTFRHRTSHNGRIRRTTIFTINRSYSLSMGQGEDQWQDVNRETRAQMGVPVQTRRP